MDEPAESLRTLRLWRAGCTATLLVLYLCVGVFDHDFWTPSEPSFAGVTWEMYTTGDVVVPAVDGLAYLEKPPLSYALSALSCAAAGRMSPGLVRLPEAILGLLSLAALFWAGRHCYGETTAWICTMLCATGGVYFGIAHRASTDGVSLFFAFLCFALFTRSIGSAPCPRDDLVLAAALALSFYAKNFFVILVVAPAILVFLVSTRQWRRWLAIGTYAVSSFVLLVVPWCIALYRRGGVEYLRIVFYDNTLGRFLTLPHSMRPELPILDDAFFVHKGSSRLMFLPAVVGEALPWIGIVACAVWVLFREPGGPRRRFLRIAFVAVLATVTLSASRAMIYYLPIVPLLFLIVGDFFHDLLGAGGCTRAWHRRIVAANLVAAALFFALAPIAAAIVLDVAAVAWLAASTLLVSLVLVLAWKSRGRWADPRIVVAWVALVAAGMMATLPVVIPYVDGENSLRPFFDEVRSASEGRELWVGFVDDRWLPLANFHLDRRLPILRDPDRIAELLAGKGPAAVLMRTREYRQQESRLAGLARTTIFSTGASRPLVLLAN